MSKMEVSEQKEINIESVIVGIATDSPFHVSNCNQKSTCTHQGRVACLTLSSGGDYRLCIKHPTYVGSDFQVTEETHPGEGRD